MPDPKYINRYTYSNRDRGYVNDDPIGHDYSYTDALKNADTDRYERGLYYLYAERNRNPHAAARRDSATPAPDIPAFDRERWLPLMWWTLALGALALASWLVYLWAVSRS